MNSTVQSSGIGINVGGKHIPSDYLIESVPPPKSQSQLMTSDNSSKEREIANQKTTQLKAESSNQLH